METQPKRCPGRRDVLAGGPLVDRAEERIGGTSVSLMRIKEKPRATLRSSQSSRPGSSRAMKRSKKTSLPANSARPAFRRRAAWARESGAPLGASASDASSQGDPLQLPERKAAAAGGGRAEAAARPSSSSSSSHPDAPLQPALSDPREPPPPPPPPRLPPDSADGGPGARGLAGQGGAMLGIFRSIPTQMDYKGQKLAEQIFQGIILFSAVIGFIYGYITEQFGWTVYIVMAGFALSCLLTLPPWPIYRRNPLKWLPVQESTTDDKKPADRKVKRHPKN